MERINLPKESLIKDIILSGIEGQGFTCAIKTNCPSTPVSLYYKRDIETIALFRTGIHSDEFMTMKYNNPARLQVIIDEYYSYNDNYKHEIAGILEKIADGSYFNENYEVTYL